MGKNVSELKMVKTYLNGRSISIFVMNEKIEYIANSLVGLLFLGGPIAHYFLHGELVGVFIYLIGFVILAFVSGTVIGTLERVENSLMMVYVLPLLLWFSFWVVYMNDWVSGFWFLIALMSLFAISNAIRHRLKKR